MGSAEEPPVKGIELSAIPVNAEEDKTIIDSEGTPASNTASETIVGNQKTSPEGITKKPPPSDSANTTELEAVLKDLPEDERRVIEEQLDSPTVSVNWFSLFRYATTWDHVFIFISVVCAAAGGAALPLFTVSHLIFRIFLRRSGPLLILVRFCSVNWQTLFKGYTLIESRTIVSIPNC